MSIGFRIDQFLRIYLVGEKMLRGDFKLDKASKHPSLRSLRSQMSFKMIFKNIRIFREYLGLGRVMHHGVLYLELYRGGGMKIHHFSSRKI